MVQIKTFSKYQEDWNNGKLEKLTDKVNEWLREHPDYTIIDIQTTTMSDKDADGQIIFTIRYSDDPKPLSI